MHSLLGWPLPLDASGISPTRDDRWHLQKSPGPPVTLVENRWLPHSLLSQLHAHGLPVALPVEAWAPV